MTFNREQLLRRLEDLNLPKGKYVVIAGGAMLLHGLRKETNDLDLSVDYDVFQKILKNKHKFGAIELKPPVHNPAGFRHNEIIHISNDVEISSGGRSLICGAPVEINGHLVQSIRDIHAFKTKLNRPKDQSDLRILRAAIKKEDALHPTPDFKKKDFEFVKRKTPRGVTPRIGKF